MNTYTNSPLVGYRRLVNKHSGKRTHIIDRITPHCVVGQVTAERSGDMDIFLDLTKPTSGLLEYEMSELLKQKNQHCACIRR